MITRGVSEKKMLRLDDRRNSSDDFSCFMQFFDCCGKKSMSRYQQADRSSVSQEKAIGHERNEIISRNDCSAVMGQCLRGSGR